MWPEFIAAGIGVFGSTYLFTTVRNYRAVQRDQADYQRVASEIVAEAMGVKVTPGLTTVHLAEDWDRPRIKERIGSNAILEQHEPFRPWVRCPKCGRFDLHWLERPRTDAPVDWNAPEDPEEPEDWEVVEYRAFGIQAPIRRHRPGHRPRWSHADERGFSVIRRCRDTNCQTRWGML